MGAVDELQRRPVRVAEVCAGSIDRAAPAIFFEEDVNALFAQRCQRRLVFALLDHERVVHAIGHFERPLVDGRRPLDQQYTDAASVEKCDALIGQRRQKLAADNLRIELYALVDVAYRDAEVGYACYFRHRVLLFFSPRSAWLDVLNDSPKIGAALWLPEHDLAAQVLRQPIEHHAHQTKQQQRREDPGHVHVEVHLQDQVAQPGFGTNKFTDDCTQNGKHEADIQPREDERQRFRQLHVTKDLPPACRERPHQVDLVLRGGPKPHYGVDEHGKERDRCGNEYLSFDPQPNPDENQGCDRHFRQGLHRHDVGIDYQFEQPHLADERADHKRCDGRKNKAKQHLLQGRQQTSHELTAAEALDQRRDDRGRGGNNQFADIEGAARVFPSSKKQNGEQRSEHELRALFDCRKEFLCPTFRGSFQVGTRLDGNAHA